MSNGPVRAAGGVVWRRNDDGEVEVVLVHRPAYDDWTLPKGKLDQGESDEDAARREVDEETGLTCRLGRELASVTYTNGKGRPKVVRYWAMQVERQRERSADDEVDQVLWVEAGRARQMVTYDRDRSVLRSLREVIS
ncbi:MAG: NUDIX hydrolase [Acidimicrobiales bacterium]